MNHDRKRTDTDIEKQIKKLQKQLETANNKTVATGLEYGAKKHECTELLGAKNSLQKDYDDLKQQNVKLKEEVSHRRVREASTSTERSEANDHAIVDKDATIAKLKKDIENYKAEVALLQTSTNTKDSEIATLSEEVTRLRQL